MLLRRRDEHPQPFYAFVEPGPFFRPDPQERPEHQQHHHAQERSRKRQEVHVKAARRSRETGAGRDKQEDGGKKEPDEEFRDKAALSGGKGQ
ncbi:hypothetical protein SDC9_165815 [bioreactor metagenome]|uniref:Uncharacterized protein n=1 Tax=bioreactor metagenome TaxID=1076179 RepID=A0A645FVG6_9ZZZZ